MHGGPRKPLASINDASSVCQEAPANDEPQEVDETMLQQQVRGRRVLVIASGCGSGYFFRFFNSHNSFILVS